MARSKKSKKSRKVVQHRRLGDYQNEDDGSAPIASFTMSREVLTTESRSLKRSALQLRYRGIQFISAGDLKPDNPKILKHIEETQPLVTETELPLVEKVQSTPEVQNSKPSNICDTIPLPPDSYQEEGRNGEEDEDRDEEEDEDEDEDEVVFKGRHFDRPDDLPGLPPGFKDRLVVVPNTLESRDEGISVTSDDSLATSARRRCTEFSEYSQHSLNKSTRTVCTELDDVDVSDAVVADYLAHIEDDMTDHESSVLDTGDYGAHADMEEHNGEQVHNRGHRTKNSKANSFQHFLDLDDDFLAVLDGTDMTSKVGSEAEVSEDLIRRRRHTTKLLSPTLAFDVDSYGDFDIMDFDRPSLKKSKKRDQVPSFGLSDSDLEWELESSWKNDRKKKKKLKKEREELRAQGLLGGKGKVNLKAKYSEGMNVEAIKSEIRGFLLSPARELCLPPMDKKARKTVHEFANLLSIKSQSRGHGKCRFPILTKTSRTRAFNSESIEEVVVLSERVAVFRQKGRLKHNRGSGVKAASYIDGEIVGASAPEIGIENRGRMMLEKMGWTNGSTLGAPNSKGILHPVMHVVKTNKAGLG